LRFFAAQIGLTEISVTEIYFMPSRRLIIRHLLISLSFVLLYLLLNRPEVVFFSRIGFVAWYPAVGLMMALMLGISPWYALLACFSAALAGRIIYAQPVMSFGNTVDAVGGAMCYGAAAYVLRGPLKVDLGLRRRRDVVRYVLVSAAAASGATIIGVACLIADHGITWHEYKAAALAWFLGDTIGLVGIAPFLLVHVLPSVRSWLSPALPLLQPTREHSNRRKFTFGALAEICGQGLTILAVCWAMFGNHDGGYGHFYTSFIPIIWIAMRHGVRRVVSGLLALNFGIAVAMHVFPPTPAVFAQVALFMLVLSAVGLLVGSEVSERHRLAIHLNEQTESLNRLVNELELRTSQMTSLIEMGNLLESSATVSDASAVVANSVQKLFPEASSGTLYLFMSSRNLLASASRWGTAGLSDPTFLPDACCSVRRGQPHWSEHPGSGITCQHLTESSTSECLCVPMIAQGNTVGMLHLEFASGDEFQNDSGRLSFRDTHQQLATSAASQIALQLANLQLRETLRERSIRDPLTQLFNRRFLEESLEIALLHAARNTKPLSVALIDIDHFKRFNDTFGHDAGDRVLKSIADLLRAFFRASDICCRNGGEEFTIILPDSSLQNAVVRANALRTEVKRLNLSYDGQNLGSITVSIGVATFPEHGSSSEALLKTADRCLYQSKASGRDVVTAAAPQSVSLSPRAQWPLSRSAGREQ
jgi:diguanylate cyclase (GGDEF)-like protein